MRDKIFWVGAFIVLVLAYYGNFGALVRLPGTDWWYPEECDVVDLEFTTQPLQCLDASTGGTPYPRVSVWEWSFTTDKDYDYVYGYYSLDTTGSFISPENINNEIVVSVDGITVDRFSNDKSKLDYFNSEGLKKLFPLKAGTHVVRFSGDFRARCNLGKKTVKAFLCSYEVEEEPEEKETVVTEPEAGTQEPSIIEEPVSAQPTKSSDWLIIIAVLFVVAVVIIFAVGLRR